MTPFPAVDALLALSPTPLRSAARDWLFAQRRVGSVLPVDYRMLVEHAGGSLRVGDFLTVNVPDARNPNVDLLVGMGDMLGGLREVKRSFGAEECPYPLWFEPEGLLPWGGTDNGDGLYWRTRGHPDAWTVVVGESRGPAWEEHAMPLADFLAAFVRGRLTSALLPQDVPATLRVVGT